MILSDGVIQIGLGTSKNTFEFPLVYFYARMRKMYQVRNFSMIEDSRLCLIKSLVKNSKLMEMPVLSNSGRYGDYGDLSSKNHPFNSPPFHCLLFWEHSFHQNCEDKEVLIGYCRCDRSPSILTIVIFSFVR